MVSVDIDEITLEDQDRVSIAFENGVHLVVSGDGTLSTQSEYDSAPHEYALNDEGFITREVTTTTTEKV